MPLSYTALGKLQEQGFVEESKKEISEDNRVRIYYRLTESGHDHLEKIKDFCSELVSTVQTIIHVQKWISYKMCKNKGVGIPTSYLFAMLTYIFFHVSI